jgi:CO dehydrogenase/acetyl-CoA synthase beta subunit
MWFKKNDKQSIEDLYNRLAAVRLDLSVEKGERLQLETLLRQIRGKFIKHMAEEEEEESEEEEEEEDDDIMPGTKGLKAI